MKEEQAKLAKIAQEKAEAEEKVRQEAQQDVDRKKRLTQAYLRAEAQRAEKAEKAKLSKGKASSKLGSEVPSTRTGGSDDNGLCWNPVEGGGCVTM